MIKEAETVPGCALQADVRWEKDMYRYNKNKRLIFLDIDGTLTPPGSNVPPESALKAIEKAREKGNGVFLCTGRNYDMLKSLLKYGFDGAVASSGGYIFCGQEVLYDHPMTREMRDQVLQTLREQGAFCTVECKKNSYIEAGLREYLQKNIDCGKNKEMLSWRMEIEKELHILPMSRYQEQPVYKIVGMTDEREVLIRAKGLLGDAFHFYITDPNEFGFFSGEVMGTDFDKGTGIRMVCEYLGVPLEQTVAFGDSINDLEMIRTAGVGICMENGSPRVKKLADRICPAVTEDGLYRAFLELGLICRTTSS